MSLLKTGKVIEVEKLPTALPVQTLLPAMWDRHLACQSWCGIGILPVILGVG